MSDFKPPLVNPLVVQLGDYVLLRLAFWWGYYDGIEVDDQTLAKMEAFADKRVVLCPNHSHAHDPIVLWAFSKLLGEHFRFVAAREIFDSWHGLQGWLLQRLGVHSVDRKVIDRKSIATTLELLKEGRQKLVVFPEGEISNRNDRLLPIQEGLVSLFFKAASAADGAPLVVVPLAMRYKYNYDIASAINNALVRLEHRLRLSSSGSLVDRFHAAREAMLQAVHPQLNITPESLHDYIAKDSRFARIAALLTFRGLPDISNENLAAGVDLIERELFGRVTQKGRRRVQITAGDGIVLSERINEYANNKRAAARRLADDIHAQLAVLLGIAQPAASPLAVDRAAWDVA